MGNRTGRRIVAAAAVLAITAAQACGDPIFFAGDGPGVLRTVVGIPDSAGSAVDSSATATVLDQPRGLVVDPDGTLYIADYGNARILRVSPSGRLRVAFQSTFTFGEPRLEAPDGIALDGAGGLVIADPEGHRVWRLALADSSLELVAGTGTRGSAPDTVADATLADLATPTGVAVDDGGTIYLSERSGHRLRRIDPDGRLVTIAGDGASGFAGDGGDARASRLSHPAGLSYAGGTLYIADQGNHRVRVIDLSAGTIRTVAGTGVAAYGGDGGPASEATLDTPTVVVATADGATLFIADTDNHRVRRVELASGTITTFAGTGDSVYNGDLMQAAATALHAPRGLAFAPPGFLFISDTGHHLVRRGIVATAPRTQRAPAEHPGSVGDSSPTP